METIQTSQFADSGSRATRITAKTIRIICILFLLFDSIAKIIRESHSVGGTIELGWPDQSVQFLGIILFVCTALYAYQRTSILGAILLTGYLGGAIATMVRVGEPLYFSLIFGIMVWVPLFLNNQKLRSLIPLNKIEA